MTRTVYRAALIAVQRRVIEERVTLEFLDNASGFRRGGPPADYRARRRRG